jgi:hypothetical protein
MHLFLARLGEHNAVVISQRTIASLLSCDERTVRRAVSMLAEHDFIEIRQIGDRGTVNAYVVNDRVAWVGARDGKRYSLFSAAVVVSADEQPDLEKVGQQGPLKRLPMMHLGERQLPTGPGLPPPSQPSLGGLEPDLPARRLDHDPETGEVPRPRQLDLEDDAIGARVAIAPPLTGALAVTFSARPSDDLRHVLKRLGFKWGSGAWRGRVSDGLDRAVESAIQAEGGIIKRQD